MNPTDLKLWTDIINNVVAASAIVAAAWWFLVTTKFKPRVQFDIECSFLPLAQNDTSIIAEVRFVFENKGFVEHKLYNLYASIHALESEKELKEKDYTRELEFKQRLLPQVSIKPEDYNYFFVRPGVRQVITHIISVPASVSAIRVTASFNYNESETEPHTARRVFKVLSLLTCNTQQ